MKRRVRLYIEYDGAAYAGWQRQKNAMSVQEKLEGAHFSLTGERLCVTGASRTDAGVSALWQVAHVDTDSAIPDEKLCFALNTKLPPDIRVWGSETVPAGFHACFSCKSKVYTYTIATGRHAPAIMRNMAWHVPEDLDTSAMQKALRTLIGEHDFLAFAASGHSVKTTVRTIFDAAMETEGRFIRLHIHGNGFLYNMVRIIAGTLVDIGKGKRDISVFEEAFLKRDRLILGQTAPPEGLVLQRIFYE